MREVQVGAVDMIGQERAARALLVPLRTEHEVIDDQMAAPVEEVGERLLAVRPRQHVGLFDLDPGQLAALSAQFIAQPGEFLLLDQVLLSRSEPLLSGNYLMPLHLEPPPDCSRTDVIGFLSCSINTTNNGEPPGHV